MSTRSKTFVIHRQEAEKYVAGFAINPAEIADKSYVNMYLHPNTQQIDVAYTYILWCGKSDVWISQWSEYEDKCTFVGSVEKLISKHNTD